MFKERMWKLISTKDNKKIIEKELKEPLLEVAKKALFLFSDFSDKKETKDDVSWEELESLFGSFENKVLFMIVKPHVFKWLTLNKPNAQFLPVFMTLEDQRKSLSLMTGLNVFSTLKHCLKPK